MKQLILALAVIGTVAVLAVVAGNDALEPGWVERYQTVLGAGFGLFGLGVVALINAELMRARDDRLRRNDGRLLAAGLCAEVRELQKYTRHILDQIENYKARDGEVTYLLFRQLKWPTLIYESNTDKLGLLSETIVRDIVELYSPLLAIVYLTNAIRALS